MATCNLLNPKAKGQPFKAGKVKPLVPTARLRRVTLCSTSALVPSLNLAFGPDFCNTTQRYHDPLVHQLAYTRTPFLRREKMSVMTVTMQRYPKEQSDEVVLLRHLRTVYLQKTTVLL